MTKMLEKWQLRIQRYKREQARALRVLDRPPKKVAAWKTPAGARWNKADRIRASRMFRHHVQSTWNPRGRIVRLPCAFEPFGHQLKESEAHHVDYDKPFVICWVCPDCHRAIERGEKKVTKTRIYDYTSLVESVVKRGNRRKGEVVGTAETSPAPF